MKLIEIGTTFLLLCITVANIINIMKSNKRRRKEDEDFYGDIFKYNND